MAEQINTGEDGGETAATQSQMDSFIQSITESLEAQATPEAPAPVQAEMPIRLQTCNIEQVLPASVIAMIKLQPTNAVYRTHVLASLWQGIPDELITYEAIKEWIEFNFKPRGPMPKAEVQVPLPTPGTNGIAIRVHHSYTEIGRCNYCVTYKGSHMKELSSDEIRRWVRNSLDEGLTFSELVENIRDEMIDETNDDPPDCSSGEDYEYNDYESTSTENNCSRLSQDDLWNRIRNWMNDNGMQDELGTLESD